MRSRGQPAGHSEAVSRRLEMLRAELHSARDEAPDAVDPPAPDEHTHIRPGGPADPWTPAVAGAPRSAEPPPAPGVPTPGRHAAPRRTRLIDVSAVQGRVTLTSAHVAVVAVLVATGLAVTTWWVLRDDPGTPLARSAPTTPLEPPLEVGATPTPSGKGSGAAVTELVVDVAGKVRRPGIVVLEPGSRVVDALEAAGGARPGVRLTDLNLARPLQDGEQVLVGVAAAPGAAASTAPEQAASGQEGGPELVDINTASATELEELSGVGPVTAEAIIEWRTSNGGFQSVDQLLEVDGIGEKTLADLSPHVTVG